MKAGQICTDRSLSNDDMIDSCMKVMDGLYPIRSPKHEDS